MANDTKLSTLPVQAPTDTETLFVVGYDLTLPTGSQDVVINLGAAIAAALAASGAGTGTTQSFITLEDGVSLFLLENGSGSILLESST